MPVCKACGTNNPTGTRFCSSCAAALDTDTQDAIVQRREGHEATAVRWPAVLLVLVILVLVVAAVAFVALHGM